MTTLVQQRETNDCGICVLAMASGPDYDLIMEILSLPENEGLYDPEEGIEFMEACLRAIGWDSKQFTNQGNMNLRPEALRQFAWGRRAIMLVPSRNDKRPSAEAVDDLHWHWIYWDGKELFDPCAKGSRYERFDQLLPEFLILFHERLE